MDYYAIIRKIARSVKYQNMYSNCEKLGLKMFKNETDLTDAQSLLLYWCSVYSSLYEDIHMNEPYIDEDIIKDDTRCDAYLTYKKEMRKKENQKKNKNKTSDKPAKGIRPGMDSIVFV